MYNWATKLFFIAMRSQYNVTIHGPRRGLDLIQGPWTWPPCWHHIEIPCQSNLVGSMGQGLRMTAMTFAMALRLPSRIGMSPYVK